MEEAVELAERFNLQLYINLCLQDWDTFAIHHLPVDVKQAINGKLESLKDSGHWSEIKKLFDYPSSGQNCNDWLAEVAKRDKYRNESFKETFPEYYQILGSLGKLDDTSI